MRGAQGLINTPHLLFRTAAAPETIVGTVRKVISAKDPELAIHDVKTLDDYVAESMASPRFEMSLLTLFASLGLVLTAVGLYGVLAYNVVQRTHELGVRFALGARPRDVVAMIMARAVALAGSGLLLGLIAAAAVARGVAATLDFVNPADGRAFVAVAVILLAVAAVAAYVPARRAARVDPMIALRAE
ncbi:MAG TPA: FtsX-like permease family protein [Vicinamibacterales bacterium]|jgi:putative ABC transport system permease protein|nr:FtsX-like permease family protein [Vicinamibacterales bacterium]